MAMGRFPFLLRWLALSALADWLVTRTLARAAIFMPKSGLVLTAYRIVVAAGQAASVLAALLALASMLWLAWQARAAFRGALSLSLIALVCLSLALQVIVPGASLQLIYHALILGAAFGMLLYALQRETSRARKVAAMVAGMALLLGGLFQAIQVLSQAVGWSKPPELTLALFNLGEVMAVLCPAAAWWAQRSSSSFTAGYHMDHSIAGERWSTYLWAAIPALGFSALSLANPSMAGILSIWSTGLTLFLPWPVYALSLWLSGVVVIASWRSGEPTGWALLLLATGGYAPQLSSGAFFGLVGLILLCRAIPQFTRLDPAVQNARLTSHVIESG